MRRELRPYAWFLGVVWGLPLLVTVIGYAVLSKDVGPDQCEGIGFGCTLSPADTLVLLAAMSSTVLVPVGLLGVIVIAVVRTQRDRRRASKDSKASDSQDQA